MFASDDDYMLFQRIIAQAQRRLAMRSIGYCLMPNHWHPLLWPRAAGELSEFGLESDLRPPQPAQKG